MTTPEATGGLTTEVTGEGEQPLLLLHGLGADHTQPLALVGPTVLRQHRAVAPDLRAHGATRLDPSAHKLTFPQLAADVEHTVASLGLDQAPVVVGISMGAAVAAELLARAELALRGLVLIRPAWHWEPNPENLRLFPYMAALLSAVGAREGKKAFRGSPHYKEVAAVSVEAAEALLGQFDAPLAVERAQRLTAIPASSPTRPTALVPTVVVGAPRDPVHPLSTARLVAEDLGAPLKIVSSRYDAPERHSIEAAQVIRHFLQEI